MFYSQIILAKKGPLGKVWLAAHWGDKKLGRTQIFSADIASSVDTIINPAVPLALRVSGHLLLGVVRIYSRKVKYLLKECDDALVNFKMAFRPDGESLKEDGKCYIMSEGTGGVVHVLKNFGEVSVMDQGFEMDVSGPIGGMMVQPVFLDGDAGAGKPFAIPFSLEGEADQDAVAGWVDAEDEDDVDLTFQNSEAARRAMERTQTQDFLSQDDSVLAAVNMTLDTQLSGMGMGDSRRQEEEEGWHSFDPDADGINNFAEEEEEERHVFDPDEDTRDDNVNRTKDSYASDIELVRGGAEEDTSMVGRPSVIGSDLASLPPPTSTTDQGSIQGSQVSDNEFPLQDEEEGPVHFNDSPEHRQDSSSVISASPENKRKSLAIGGLDMDLSEEQQQQDKQEGEEMKTKTPKIRTDVSKRRRKRRRIHVDNDTPELSSAHIKAMLRDTSDIVQQNRVHPADYVPVENNVLPWRKKVGTYAGDIAALSYERLLARPNLADDGALCPDLLHVWDKNFSRLRGELLPFRMRGESGEEQRRQAAEDIMNDAAAKEAEKVKDEEDIEMGRNLDVSYEEGIEDRRLSVDADGLQDKLEDEENMQFPQHEDEEEIPVPFDDEEEEQLVQQEVNVSFAEDMVGMISPANSEDSRRSSFSLGAVNALEEELSGDSRQEQGDELTSSATKLHKHTVMVLGMLKKNMTDEETEDDTKARELSYDKLSYGTSRRTACGVFFELLQLKTWDFIDLNQEESYSDIKIAPGVRFSESPPLE